MEKYVLMLQTDADDQELTESIVSGIQFQYPVKFLADSEELDNYIAAVGSPLLIMISDSSRGMAVNMLKKIKNKSAFAHIPLVILGEQALDSYVKDCYRAGVNTYIVKPSTMAETKKKIEIFFTYWFEVAEL